MKRKFIASVGLGNYPVRWCDSCRTYRNYRIIVALVVRHLVNPTSLLAERSPGTCTIFKDPLSKESKKDKERMILQVFFFMKSNFYTILFI